ncbi:MAG: hypothetical protein LBF12_03015 [Christensenellaceae bacterium]|jgi:hypothetical protein|nr:hypothetical protein [Christensenellaceae bacterium]
MKYNILLPNAIWQNYEPEAIPLETELMDKSLEDGMEISTYSFVALSAQSGKLVVIAKKYVASDSLLNKDVPVVLIVPEYHRMPSLEFIKGFVLDGFIVIVPDMAGNDQPKTQYPAEYEYGEYTKAGDHIRTVMPTARETCQYLYSLIMRRALVFLKDILPDPHVLLIGLGDAVEVAMQTTGSGADIVALACINGSGYREYIKLNKYGSCKELEMTDETVCWLSGVASAAYAKLITKPTFIAIGTNGERSDIDRINNLVALLPTESTYVSFSPKASDYIFQENFNTLKNWFKMILSEYCFPKMPTLSVNVNDDGKIYATIECDEKVKAINANLYYSYGEYNHVIRDWRKKTGIVVSANEFIATIEVTDANAPLFVFAEVEYLGGIILSSLEKYLELAGQPVKSTKETSSRVIYSTQSPADSFVENYNKEVLFEHRINLLTAASGVKGLACSDDGVRNYHLGIATQEIEECLLQIEFSTSKSSSVIATLICKDGDSIKKYQADIHLQDSKGFFISLQLKKSDFKDNNYMPLTTWSNAKALEISGGDTVIGNILFI